MTSYPAISQKGSRVIVGLELLRGLACMEVLGSHLLQFANGLNDRNFLSIIFEWGYPAVVVFFCLSGFIISRSQVEHHRSKGHFIVSRFYRIAPIYIFALGFTLIIESIGKGYFPWQKFLAHLFFLQSTGQEHLDWVFETNTAFWSLSPEWWFYMIFALTFGPLQTRYLLIWLGIGILSYIAIQSGLPFDFGAERLFWILCFSPIWVAAAMLGRTYSKSVFSLSQALIIFSFIPLLQSEYRIWSGPNMWGCYLIGIVSFLLISALTSSEKTIESWKTWGIVAFAYLSLAFCFWSHPLTQQRDGYDTQFPWFYWFILLLPLGTAVISRFPLPHRLTLMARSPVLAMGRLSYGIYLIHLPIAIVAGNVLNAHEHPWRWVYVIGIIGLMAIFLEYVYHPFIVQFLRKLFYSQREERGKIETGLTASASKS